MNPIAAMLTVAAGYIIAFVMYLAFKDYLANWFRGRRKAAHRRSRKR